MEEASSPRISPTLDFGDPSFLAVTDDDQEHGLMIL